MCLYLGFRIAVQKSSLRANKVLADVLGGKRAKSLGKFWVISFSKGSADRKCEANVKISLHSKRMIVKSSWSALSGFQQAAIDILVASPYGTLLPCLTQGTDIPEALTTGAFPSLWLLSPPWYQFTQMRATESKLKHTCLCMSVRTGQITEQQQTTPRLNDLKQESLLSYAQSKLVLGWPGGPAAHRLSQDPGWQFPPSGTRAEAWQGRRCAGFRGRHLTSAHISLARAHLSLACFRGQENAFLPFTKRTRIFV